MSGKSSFKRPAMYSAKGRESRSGARLRRQQLRYGEMIGHRSWPRWNAVSKHATCGICGNRREWRGSAPDCSADEVARAGRSAGLQEPGRRWSDGRIWDRRGRRDARRPRSPASGYPTANCRGRTQSRHQVHFPRMLDRPMPCRACPARSLGRLRSPSISPRMNGSSPSGPSRAKT